MPSLMFARTIKVYKMLVRPASPMDNSENSNKKLIFFDIAKSRFETKLPFLETLLITKMIGGCA